MAVCIGQADGYCAAEASVGALGGSYLACCDQHGLAWSRFDPDGGAWVRLDGARSNRPPRTASLDGGGPDVALDLTANGIYDVNGNSSSVWFARLVTPARCRPASTIAATGRTPPAFAGGTGVPDSLTGAWVGLRRARLTLLDATPPLLLQQ